MNGPMRIRIFERIVWEKMEPGVELYYGDPPRYVVMKTTRAYLIETDMWCQDIHTICQFHEKRISRRRFKHMREREVYES